MSLLERKINVLTEYKVNYSAHVRNPLAISRPRRDAFGIRNRHVHGRDLCREHHLDKKRGRIARPRPIWSYQTQAGEPARR